MLGRGREEDFSKQRDEMVRDLERRGIRDKRVLKALDEIPREKFVRPIDQRDAYADGPLAIDCGQTISQPYMVALMTECMQLKGGEKVLEIGTGSGYQTAILARLAREVFTVERLSELSRKALDILAQLEIENVFATAGDGTKGLPDFAPYDAIMVTAGAPDWPEPLKEQLADPGRLIAPLGGSNIQTLKVLTRSGKQLTEQSVCSCKFVKLIGEYGWE
jgi:protein-L-isoaspartate(D-aspartate) O-methyltransferase